MVIIVVRMLVMLTMIITLKISKSTIVTCSAQMKQHIVSVTSEQYHKYQQEPLVRLERPEHMK